MTQSSSTTHALALIFGFKALSPFCAHRRGWLPGVSLLLAGGAKHGLVNKRGLTALGEAVAGGHADVAKQLIGAGADVRCGAGGG